MRAFWAITSLTCRSAMRTHFFRGLLLLLLCVALGVPLFVKSDGTAVGTIRITLEYSLGIIAFLLSVSAIWFGGSEITSDVTDARLHMIVSKPVSRISIFFAKFSGVLLIHAGLLIVSAAMVYGLTMYRTATAELTPEERDTLDNEVLTARQFVRPDFPDEMVDEAAEDMLKRMIDEAHARGEEIPEEWLRVRDDKGDFTRAEIIKRIRETYRMNQDKIAPGAVHAWTFSGLPEDLDGPVRIRFKMFVSETQTLQSRIYGIWGWRYDHPMPNAEKGERAQTDVMFFPSTTDASIVSLRVAEFEIGPRLQPGKQVQYPYLCVRSPLTYLGTGHNYQVTPMSYPGPDHRMVQNGKGTLLFQNMSRNQTLFIQRTDGPFLLIPRAGFFSNFVRAVLAVFIQIAAFASLGTAFSAWFSLPMGILLTAAYVIFSASTQFIVKIYSTTAVKPHNLLEWFSFYAGKVAEYILIDPTGFSPASMLASGELIEFSMLGMLFLRDVILKTLPVLLLGLFFYHQRELALEVKE